jgi:cell division septum initiation protein DivIVA
MAPLLETIASILGIVDSSLGIAGKLDGSDKVAAYDPLDEEIRSDASLQELVQERDRVQREVEQGRQLRDLRREMDAQVDSLESTELPIVESMVQLAEELWTTENSRAEKLLDEAQQRNDRAKEIISLARDTQNVVKGWKAGGDVGTELERLKERIRKIR